MGEFRREWGFLTQDQRFGPFFVPFYCTLEFLPIYSEIASVLKFWREEKKKERCRCPKAYFCTAKATDCY